MTGNVDKIYILKKPNHQIPQRITVYLLTLIWFKSNRNLRNQRILNRLLILHDSTNDGNGVHNWNRWFPWKPSS